MPKILRCLVVENEMDAAEYLMDFIAKMPDKLVFVAQCDGAIKAKRILESNEIDLIFLDLQLSGGTDGIGFLEFCKVSQQIIIVSAVIPLIQKSFSYNVNGYLKKPFDFVDFKNKISHLNFEVNKVSEGVKDLQNTAEVDTEKPFYLKVTDKGETKERRLHWEELVYVKTAGNLIELHFRDRSVWRVWKTLKLLLDEAEGKLCQIHQSYAFGNPDFLEARNLTTKELILNFKDKDDKPKRLSYNPKLYGDALDKHLKL